jgi:hypothetical protein
MVITVVLSAILLMVITVILSAVLPLVITVMLGHGPTSANRTKPGPSFEL